MIFLCNEFNPFSIFLYFINSGILVFQFVYVVILNKKKQEFLQKIEKKNFINNNINDS